mgnify:CR=1 FL=1
MGHVGRDVAHNVRLGHHLGLADGVEEGVGIGGAVGLDDRLRDAQQGGAPTSLASKRFLKAPMLFFQQQGGQLVLGAAQEHVL